MILWKGFLTLLLAVELGGGRHQALVASIAVNDGQFQDDTSSYQIREILLKLFENTNGFDWTESRNWFQQKSDFCSWHGVSCYADDDTDERKRGQVQLLDLSENNLVGTVPSEVFQIPYLKQLNLDDNADVDIDLSGVGYAQFLTRLSVSNTQVSTLSGISDAGALEILDISNLNLRGFIPAELFDMTNLKALFANVNKFSGPIPTAIGSLSNLVELYLYDSDLTGPIPTEIGLLSRLEILALSQNAFSGFLPTEMELLTDLQTLAIEREAGAEKGLGIGGDLLSFAHYSKITELLLQRQRLTGPIQLDFLMRAPKSDQIIVDLASNLLTGTVPSSLLDIGYLDIFLQDNQIEAVSVSIYSTDNGLCPAIATWMSGDVATVGCDAFLCPPGTWAPDGQATATTPCAVCADDAFLWGRVECDSTTPVTVQDREILVNLYNRMGGRFWSIDSNWLDFAVPICEWHGIKCTSDGLVNSINLENNELTNALPTEVFELPELQVLNLRSNQIDFDFTGIGNAKKLISLDVSDAQLSPASMRQVQELASLTQLKFLSIASNGLTGTLPKALFQATSLTELSIAQNKFSGTLHSEVGNMINLSHFGCAGNELTGQFPSEIGTILPLQQLLASENKFTGSLPTELGNLVNLEVLQLHQVTVDEKIGGPLPAFENLQQLTTLELDDNAITGNLPSNFLQSTLRANDRIEISLSFNELLGTIPASWSLFNDLFLDVTGNQITGIDSSLCSKSQWMDGAVGTYNCDAILCPSQTFNDVGRASTAESTCESCSDNKYLGSTTCGNGDIEDPEIDILRNLFYSTKGTGWKDASGWTDSSNKCQDWFGIECNGAGSVTSIDLTANGLSGTPDTSIFQLPNLRELYLTNNPLDFIFDGISQATSLVTLDLEGTGLDSVAGLSDAADSLLNLNLQDNHLEGEIPGDLFLMPQLRELYLGFNKLSGNIPTHVGNWVQLEKLGLQHNHLTGPVPAFLGSMTTLQELILAENNFDGTIPESLNELTNLRVLSLQREGGIDGLFDIGINQGDSSALGLGLTGPLPAFEKLVNIQSLFLGVNSLTGPVPFNFLDGVLTKQTSEIKVDLTSNRLTGTLPASLTQFDNLSLFVGDNRITAIAPGLCLKQNWLKGDVKNYSCDGILCPANTYNPYGRKTTDEFLCVECPQATNGYLGGFGCLSATDKLVQSERDILERIYDEMDGDSWVYNTNWKDADESICTWYGITCVSDTEESVAGIHLENNRLLNQLPSVIYQLPNLEELGLQGNLITFTTNGIGNAINLEYLDLEGTGLTSLDGLAAASELVLLRAGMNKLQEFPEAITSLSKLEVLSLSENPFPQAGVPSSILKLANLVYFACSECGFVGSLPTWLGGFAGLEYLRLDHNGFEGTLPTQLESLVNLKHLDLADQKSFGGGIIGNLLDFSLQSQLTELYVQQNDLNGTIPTTLLQSVNKNGLVTIDLRTNSFSGGIPTELGLITYLNLYVSKNQINILPTQICSNSWNEGNVKAHGCDGILCPKGTFNAYGRAVGNLACLPCDQDGAGAVQYFGSTSCGADFEHSTLIRLYRDLNGPNWSRDHNWLSSDDHCTWEGITCYDSGEYQGMVQSLDLKDNNMVGSTSGSIWQLAGLTSVNLEKNNISLSFDFIDNAINLQTIILSQTKLSSLAGIWEASTLKVLHLTNTELQGSIPDELYDLTLLQGLYLSYNALSGSLSTLIGRMTALRDLYLFSNSIRGTLPTEIGRLASIERLSLGQNSFSGTIPSEIESLPLLELLSLHQEAVLPGDMFSTGGGGFNGTLPAFDGLPRLRELYLGNNLFHGPIPDSFIQGIIDKDVPITIDISENFIEGSIPTFLGLFKSLNLYAAGNLIYDIPPEVCAQVDWMNGEVLSGCDAILCLPGTYNKFGRRVDSQTPCEVCTYPGFATDIYGSVACGPVFADTFDDRSILFELYEATGGDGWTDKKDWKNDKTDFCDWFGVTCEPVGELGTMTVTELNLAANNLNGIIPSILYHLPALKTLNVKDNNVKITFNAIFQAELIETLNLDGTQVSNLDGIDRATSLKTLHLSRNSFNWQRLPDALFNLASLTDLDFHDARFSGTLSTMIGQLSNLKSLNMVGNDISGQLPSEIGQLSALENLFLSGNNFYGTLPDSFSGLVSLVALFFDNTKSKTAGITGPLLPFSTMPDLTELHFSANQLTGSIPTDFLLGVTNLDVTIDAFLDKNQLIGTVPSELARFSKLNIELADNNIVSIGDGLCDRLQWLDGTVGKYSCDAILCPAGQYSDIFGRQVSDESKCKPCPGAESSPYLGVSSCLTIEKQREREVLELFFTATNGKGWKNSDGWMDDAVDICKWYGISCREGATVESILLGSNNLVGTPPKELFDLANLRFLWLYSNPMAFSFEGIEKATSLRSLLLDSTMLESLNGIGAATSLVDLDVRFNQLKGTLPTEMQSLTNLESLSCSDNQLSGTVPSFGGSPKLNTIRMGGNRFTGQVPSFAGHPALKSLDLSENMLAGSIPKNLLELADIAALIFLDLSQNQLTGTIPSELSRFDDLTLYVRDNKLEGVDPKLCGKAQWNGGDVGNFQCDGILCPSGTFSISGRASKAGARCEPCAGNLYFGSTKCGTASGATSVHIGWLLTAALSIYGALF